MIIIFFMKICFWVLLIVAVQSLDNGLGITPPMGWNSWNHYGCNINESIVKETAQLLIKTGLADKGYKYINIDDCWQKDRNQTTGQIIPDSKRFPSGMASLAEYVHDKGLLFGLYSDAGTKTCQGRPGSYSYEEIDARTYAKWKIDFLKYDNCHNEGLSPKYRYPFMRDALNKTGRHIYFSMCEWGREKPQEWAQNVANSWRTTVDIKDLFQSMLHNLEHSVGLSKYAGPGAWNDPDMLEVGNGGMSQEQYQTHFSFWAALKAPLIIGCSLKNISNATLSILGNEELIAINQDPLGVQADLIERKVHEVGFEEIWGGDLSNNRYVIICFNRAETTTVFHIPFSRPEFRGMKVTKIRDVVEHKDIAIPTTSYFQTKTVKRHAVANYIFTLAPKGEHLSEE